MTTAELTSKGTKNYIMAAAREVAEDIRGWGHILIIPFALYLLFAGEQSSVFSLKSIALIFGAELMFVVTAILYNLVTAGASLLLLSPIILFKVFKSDNYELDSKEAEFENKMSARILIVLSLAYLPLAYYVTNFIYEILH